MTGTTPHTRSLRSRSRHWSSVACVTVAAMGWLALSQEHYLHGGLAIAAALVLLRQSSLVRRPSSVTGTQAMPAPVARTRAWRKAA